VLVAMRTADYSLLGPADSRNRGPCLVPDMQSVQRAY
jgi:hypothetical protein